jgi:adenylosuccinate lyase
LRDELPFMASEEILMAAVRAGGDRQQLHERIRIHSHEAARVVKEDGAANDLIDRLRQDPEFRGVTIGDALDVGRYVGRAPEQVEAFLDDVIGPIRRRYSFELGERPPDVNV